MEQKVMLSCSLRRDQVHINHGCESGHTLLSSSSPTLMFNKPVSMQCPDNACLLSRVSVYANGLTALSARPNCLHSTMTILKYDRSR